MRKLPLADRLRIGSPCSLGDAWAEMSEGDDGTRFCGSCRKEVHDVASLGRDDVLALLRSRSASGGLCIRIHTRKTDGAILLADGHALPSDRLLASGLAAAAATISAAALAGCSPSSQPVAPPQYVDIGAVPAGATPPVIVEPTPAGAHAFPAAAGAPNRAGAPPPLPPSSSEPLVARSPLVPKPHAHTPATPKAVTTTPPKRPTRAGTPSKTIPPSDDYTITAGEIAADAP